MAFYYLLIGLLVFLGIGKIKGVKENKVLFVVICFFWLLASLRSVTIGNDTSEYLKLFNNVNNGVPFSVYQGRYEIGYFYLNSLIGHVTSNFNVFLLIINAFIYYAYYLFIKKYSSDYMLSALLFLCFGYWGQTVNVIRLQIAIAIFIYVNIIIIDKQKKIAGIILGISAVLFHRISIAYLFSIILPKRISKKFFFISTAMAIALYFLLGPLISVVLQYIPYYGSYVNASSIYSIGDVSTAILVRMLLSFLVWCIAISVYIKNKDFVGEKEQIIIETQINTVYVSFLILFLATEFNLLDRCEILFGLYSILLIPNLLHIFKNRNNTRVLRIVFIVIAILYFTIVNIYRPDWNHIYPYHSFLYDI